MQKSQSTTKICPCGSGSLYAQCCRKYHQGVRPETPELLMRSRYSAYVLCLSDYLLETWHISTRPEKLSLDSNPAWCQLLILDSTFAQNEGMVHFKAIHKIPDGWRCLEEKSRFLREGDQWYYLAGEVKEGSYVPGRNSSCPCGSGKKFKQCCL